MDSLSSRVFIQVGQRVKHMYEIEENLHMIESDAHQEVVMNLGFKVTPVCDDKKRYVQWHV